MVQAEAQERLVVWNIIGSAINSGFGFGKEYLKGKRQIEEAEVGLKLAELEAQTSIAKQAASMEMEALKQTGGLDYLAVKQSAKSVWDEAICCLPFALIGYMTWEVFNGTEGKGDQVIKMLGDLPWWLQGLVILIYVRYLGYRSLLRLGVKTWGQQRLGFGMFGKKKNENARASQADGRN